MKMGMCVCDVGMRERLQQSVCIRAYLFARSLTKPRLIQSTGVLIYLLVFQFVFAASLQKVLNAYRYETMILLTSCSSGRPCTTSRRCVRDGKNASVLGALGRKHACREFCCKKPRDCKMTSMILMSARVHLLIGCKKILFCALPGKWFFFFAGKENKVDSKSLDCSTTGQNHYSLPDAR